jgi:hypothetical protein
MLRRAKSRKGEAALLLLRDAVEIATVELKSPGFSYRPSRENRTRHLLRRGRSPAARGSGVKWK